MVKDIDTYRFKLNTYDPCIVKKPINRKYMKVVCHVDDLKVSHVYSFEITDIAGYLSKIYWGLMVHCGKVDDYMGIYFSNKANMNLSLPGFYLVWLD